MAQYIDHLCLYVHNILYDSATKTLFVGISFKHTKIKRNSDDTFATSVSIISTRQPVAEHVRVVGELPFAHFGRKGFNDASSTTRGNPYIGVEIESRNASVMTELGFRLPVIRDNDSAASLGVISANDRLEAFLSNRLSLNAMVNYLYRVPSGLVVRLRGGPVFIAGTERSDVVAGYSAQVWYMGPQAMVGGGLSGRAILTDSVLLSEESGRTVDQFGITGSAVLGRVHPGLHIRVPLDKTVRDSFNPFFGLQVEVQW